MLFHLGDKCESFVGHMRKRDILVRDRSKDYGCTGCVRITVGTREHNCQLLTALDAVFANIGLREQVAG